MTIALRATPAALAGEYAVDKAQSEALTAYLREHRLPLVGAQVLKSADGGERLLLYGFVATDRGRSDAQQKALAYLQVSGIPVDNRIAVRPEIATMKRQAAGGESSQPSPTPAGVSLDQVLDDIAHYGIKAAPGQGGP